MATVAVLAATNDRNLALAERFVESIRAAGHEATLTQLSDLGMPVFTTEESKANGTPASLDALWDVMSSADGWLVCAPEYNGAAPPTLVNAITWLSTRWSDFRALFNGRPVALATSSGGGGEYIITAMRNQFLFLGCDVIGRSIIEKGGDSAKQESIDHLVERLLSRC
jgi:chromate reductase